MLDACWLNFLNTELRIFSCLTYSALDQWIADSAFWVAFSICFCLNFAIWLSIHASATNPSRQVADRPSVGIRPLDTPAPRTIAQYFLIFLSWNSWDVVNRIASICSWSLCLLLLVRASCCTTFNPTLRKSCFIYFFEINQASETHLPIAHIRLQFLV